MVQQYDMTQMTTAPKHTAEVAEPVNLGVASDIPLKKDGTPDKRYKQGE